MNSRQKAYESVALTSKKARLILALHQLFDTAALLILHIDDDKTKSDPNEYQMKNLIARAKAHGCTKYITARQYNTSGDLMAFWFFSDLDIPTAKIVAKRWKLGWYEEHAISTHDNNLYRKSLFTNNNVPKNKFLFSPKAGIWRR